MSRTMGEQLFDVLRQAGVERVYGIVADSLKPLVDAIRRTDVIDRVDVRDEEAGAFAAAAEAQLTGRLAVCAASRGPGNTHLVRGLYDAHRSGAPGLALASRIPSEQIGASALQETHPERLLVDCSDLCQLVSQTAQMPRLAGVAIGRAPGRGGFSVLVLQGDGLHRPATRPTGDWSPSAARGTVISASMVRFSAATWRQCAMCWGQRQILIREPSPNGEGDLLRAVACESCLGLGEVLR